MRDRPILFSAPMIQALLAGTKTQTRRIVKNPDYFGCLTGDCPHQRQSECDVFMATQAPYGVPGDLLIVRETHWRWGQWRKDGLTKAGHQRWRFRAIDTHPVAYCLPDDKRLAMATCYPGMDHETIGYWKRPSLFMERKHSRLTLEIIDVLVERLSDITNEDAQAEGVTLDKGLGMWRVPGRNDFCMTPSAAYRALWGHINGPDSWAANPFVWVVVFRVYHMNVDRCRTELGA